MFFDGDTLPFVFFSKSHWIPLLLLTLSIIGLFFCRKTLQHQRISKVVRYSLALLLIVLEAALYSWYFSTGHFSPASSLPLHLCGFSYLLTIMILIYPHHYLHEFLYFAGIGGALQALTTPAAILSGYPHFTYFYFFIGHGAIVWVALYMTWIEGYRPSKASIGRVWIILNIYSAVIFFVNQWTGGNYLFIARKPQGTLLDWLGPWPWYILSLEGIALVIFGLLYLPFLLSRNNCTRRTKHAPPF